MISDAAGVNMAYALISFSVRLQVRVKAEKDRYNAAIDINSGEHSTIFDLLIESLARKRSKCVEATWQE